MTLTPDSDVFYVLIWREATSARLRTYVTPDGEPIAVPLGDIFPTAAQALDSPHDLQLWLDSPVSEETIAITEAIAQSELGWNPRRAINSEGGT